MKISVIHPSRNRPIRAYATACKFKYYADSPFEYILSMDNDDPDLSQYLELFDNFGSTAIGCTYDNKSAIEAINNAASKATGDILIVISDDFDCVKGWDTLLLKELEGKSDFLLKTQDGIQPVCITLPIMDRVYYNRFGYIYHPDYRHMAADVELTAVGRMLGRVINSNLLFEHLHYTVGKSPKDAINEKNDLTYQYGDMVLAEHLKTNFGINDPLINYNQIQWH